MRDTRDLLLFTGTTFVALKPFNVMREFEQVFNLYAEFLNDNGLCFTNTTQSERMAAAALSFVRDGFLKPKYLH